MLAFPLSARTQAADVTRRATGAAVRERAMRVRCWFHPQQAVQRRSSSAKTDRGGAAAVASAAHDAPPERRAAEPEDDCPVVGPPTCVSRRPFATATQRGAAATFLQSSTAVNPDEAGRVPLIPRRR